MTTIPVTYSIGVEGAQQALAEMRKMSAEQERAAELQRDVNAAEKAAYMEDRTRTVKKIEDERRAADAIRAIKIDAIRKEAEAHNKAQAERRAEVSSELVMSGAVSKASIRKSIISAGLGTLADQIKVVGKDLDNISTQSQKNFAMMAEGALSIGAALAAGGPAAAIGLATIGLSKAADEYTKLKKADAEFALTTTRSWEELDKRVKDTTESIIRANQKVSQADLESMQALHQAQTREAERLQEQLGAIEYDAGEESKERRALLRTQIEAIELRSANLVVSINEAAREKQDKITIEEAERLKLEEIALEKAALEKRRAINRDYNSWIREENKRNVEYNSLLARLASQDAMADFNKAVSRNQSVENAFKAAEGALIDTRANTNIAIREMELKAKQDRVRISYDERVEIVRNLADLASERDILALDKRKRELDDSVKTKQLTRDEADALWTIEQQAYASRQQARDKDLEQTIDAMNRKAAAERIVARDAGFAAVATEGMRHEAQAWGITMSMLTPIVAEFTGAMRQLGDVNRENWQDFVMQGEELPRILARKAQAFLANVAAEAAGKSFFEGAEAIRETALGVGLMFVPGMQGQAGGHIASAALHVAAANAYAAIGGGAAAGAVAIGASRGQGGLVGLTKEEREERDRKRAGDSPRGGGGSMGGSGNSRGRQDSGQTVFNITMEYGAFALAPEDPRRIARAFSSGERIARRDGFARLNG